MQIVGLTSEEAGKLLSEYGKNKLPESKLPSPLIIFLNQFKNIFSLMLSAAVIISFFLGDVLDGALILIILSLNSILGFWQEYKASREIKALQNYEPPKSRVIRDGKEQEILSENLVPGDIVVLSAGDKIPADGEMTDGYELNINESSLTGESIPVLKSIHSKNKEVFLGTWVISGEGKIKISATGANTRFGKIAANLGSIKEEPTPLEKSLNKLAVKVSLVIFSIAFILAVIGIYQDVELIDVFLNSLALIIAAVPEGLPAIITVLLAIGARRMYHRKSLIRKMDSIENLGTTDIICIDKTGTITKNEMAVRKFELRDKKEIDEFIKVSVLCNTASLAIKEKDGSPDILGDTMEGALLIWAKDQGIDISSLKESAKIVKEFAFDSKRKMMSVVIEENGENILLSKGAPEVILNLCKLTEKEKEELTVDYEDMAKQGLRVLAISTRNLGKNIPTDPEKDMKFLGFVGIADEPREEAKESILKAKRAGIDIVMITGDNELTAKAIAHEVGLLNDGDEIITSEQLDKLSDEELKKRIEKIRIYARTTPEHKLRIVKNFQEMGRVVAVTGDGVNDSLALKKAEVGIAMGITGTDVAKESSDIIILDDNLSTIIQAIEQGRLIYRNIVKVVRFLLTGNFSEVLLIIIITLMGYPVPLLPAQILWINFVTDGLPAISLAADKTTGKEMDEKPRGKNHSLFNFETLGFVSLFGFLISLVSVFAFVLGFSQGGIETARSYAFTTMIVAQMAFVLLVIRRGSPFFSNKYLLASVAFVLFIQLLIISFPPLRQLFSV